MEHWQWDERMVRWTFGPTIFCRCRFIYALRIMGSQVPGGLEIPEPSEKQSQTPPLEGPMILRVYICIHCIPSLKLTACTWKSMVGRWMSFWDGLFSGGMLVSGRVYILRTPDNRFFNGWNWWNTNFCMVKIWNHQIEITILKGMFIYIYI